MRITINAGHTKIGTGQGAVGLLKESVETRKIAYELLKLLADTGHEVVPAIFDRSDSNLQDAVEAAHGSDLFLSIHLNAGGGAGCEAYTWRAARLRKAEDMLKNLSKLGFKNRGIHDGSRLYVIKNTPCTAILLEVCFIDNKDDVGLFKELGYEHIAKAIFEVIK